MKKIGNYVLGFLLISICWVTAQDDISVKLQLKTAQGAPLRQASVGEAFTLNVVVQGATGAINMGSIEASDEFRLRPQGTTNRMISVGGPSTHETLLHYTVRSDQTGNFTLGPAQLTIGGYEYTSNVVTVGVTEQSIAQNTLDQPCLELIVGAQDGSMVVGQTVPFKVRFYHLNASQLQQIIPPEVPEFSLGKLAGPSRGTEIIEGVPYEYVEWRTYITANKVGSFVIKPAHAVYAMQSRQRSSLFQLLSDHFSFGMQEYETNSNVVRVTVDPLPPYHEPTHAVGHFTRLHASVNQTCVKQGEGIVYTLELMGDESLPRVAHPPLVLPDTLISYESKSSIQLNRYASSAPKRKLFEYVIQAREQGPITIPAQIFTFYDPLAKRYGQLVTEPIELTIMQADHAAAPVQPGELDNGSNDEGQGLQEEPAEPAEPERLPLYKRGRWYPVVDTGFSPFVFWLFLLIILGAIVVQWGRFFWYGYRMRNYDHLRQRAAFVTARRCLQVAKRQRSAQQVYDLFITVFADRRVLKKSQITEQDMIQWLQDAQLPDATRHQWQEYIRQLQTYAFYDQATVPSDELFEQAKQWLALLEKLV